MTYLGESWEQAAKKEKAKKKKPLSQVDTESLMRGWELYQTSRSYSEVAQNLKREGFRDSNGTPYQEDVIRQALIQNRDGLQDLYKTQPLPPIQPSGHEALPLVNPLAKTSQTSAGSGCFLTIMAVFGFGALMTMCNDTPEYRREQQQRYERNVESRIRREEKANMERRQQEFKEEIMRIRIREELRGR